MYDSQYTHSIPGSFLAQQVLNFLFLGVAIGGYMDLLGMNVPWMLAVIGVTAGTTLIISAALIYRLLVLTKNSGLPIFGYWTANAGDMSRGVQMPGHRATWRGVARSNFRDSNAFALAAIALLLTRIGIALTQLQNEDYSTRTKLQSFEPAAIDWFTVLVGYPEERYKRSPLNGAETSHSYQVQMGIVNNLGGGFDECASGGLYDSRYNEYTSRFRRFDCYVPGAYSFLFKYMITPTNETEAKGPMNFPWLWFTASMGSNGGSHVIDPDAPIKLDEYRIHTIPYLAAPLQPSPGMHTTTDLSLIKRRFIVSSALQDAITGSKPRYSELNLLKTSQASAIAGPDSSWNTTLSQASSSRVAYGSVSYISGIGFQPTATDDQLKQSEGSPLCQVIEDYRESSAFDLLGSVGGLLALLQGIHIFLFGRPLFWGMFGAKLITPFGFVGRFAPGGLQQQLRDRYNAQGAIKDSDHNQTSEELSSAIAMNLFLLECVIDMGPASTVDRQPRRNSGSTTRPPNMDFSNWQGEVVHLTPTRDDLPQPVAYHPYRTLAS
ncbi:hypothetical protein FRC07_005138 [Ceratobasidium sp. 392]|nr:hypothetical protein FRC07_005138 [Ceratobasidium sp. 392]